jgi:hypothetical protein
VEEEALVVEVHPVGGSWSRSIGVLLYLLFILATGNVFAESQNIREIRQYYQRISSETTRCLLIKMSGHYFGDICISCVVIAVGLISVVSLATVLWVGFL